jgi:hypothetical protein
MGHLRGALGRGAGELAVALGQVGHPRHPLLKEPGGAAAARSMKRIQGARAMKSANAAAAAIEQTTKLLCARRIGMLTVVVKTPAGAS